MSKKRGSYQIIYFFTGIFLTNVGPFSIVLFSSDCISIGKIFSLSLDFDNSISSSLSNEFNNSFSSSNLILSLLISVIILFIDLLILVPLLYFFSISLDKAFSSNSLFKFLNTSL